MKSFVVLALAAAAVASPWPQSLPEETGKVAIDFDMGISPMPTMAPLLGEAVDLKKRVVFQDRTCGYTSGDANAPDLCQVGLTCAINSASNAIGCCSDLNNCGYWTDCYDRTALTCIGSTCTRSANVLSCTDTVSSMCAAWQYQLGAHTGYYFTCAPSRFVTTVLTTTTSSSSRSSFALTLTSSSSTSTTSQTTSSSSAIETSPTPSPAPKKKSNVGAIVGGVVGGLGAIALIGIGACVLLTRKKKPAQPQQGVPQPYVPPAGPQPPAYPQQQKDYYGNPIASPVGVSPQQMSYAQPQQPMMNQVPSPGGMSYQTPPQGYATPGYAGTPVAGYAGTPVANYAGTPPIAPAGVASPVYHQGGSPPVQQVVSPVPQAGFQQQDQRYSQNFTAELPAGNYK